MRCASIVGNVSQVTEYVLFTRPKCWLNIFPILIALGIGYNLRAIHNLIHPIVELSKSGDKYTLTTTSNFKNFTITFESGKEFDEVTLDGERVKSVITMEGNKMIHKQSGYPGTKVIREFSDNEMVAYMKADQVVSVATYYNSERLDELQLIGLRRKIQMRLAHILPQLE